MKSNKLKSTMNTQAYYGFNNLNKTNFYIFNLNLIISTYRRTKNDVMLSVYNHRM